MILNTKTIERHRRFRQGKILGGEKEGNEEEGKRFSQHTKTEVTKLCWKVSKRIINLSKPLKKGIKAP